MYSKVAPAREDSRHHRGVRPKHFCHTVINRGKKKTRFRKKGQYLCSTIVFSEDPIGEGCDRLQKTKKKAVSFSFHENIQYKEKL